MREIYAFFCRNKWHFMLFYLVENSCMWVVQIHAFEWYVFTFVQQHLHNNILVEQVLVLLLYMEVNENISDYICTLFFVSCSSQLMRTVRKTRAFPWLEAWAICLIKLFSTEWPCCAASHVSPPFFHMIEWSSHLKSDALMAIIYVAFTGPSHLPVRLINCSFMTLESKHLDNEKFHHFLSLMSRC